MNAQWAVAISLGLICMALPCAAQELLRHIATAELARTGLPDGVGFAPADGTSSTDYLVIRGDTGPPTRTIVDLVDPGITQARYGVMGEVRCEDVQGHATLETQNYFADGGVFFSRAAEPPALRQLSGTSDWRSFLLPFYCVGPDGDTGQRPTRVELRLTMPAHGTIALRGLTLIQYTSDHTPLPPGQWWSERNGALLGGGLGGLIGLLGALIGLLAGLGRARRTAVGLVYLMIVIGVVGLTAGATALLDAQPYAVYYPLLLTGGLLLLPLTLLASVRRRYAQQELRRMHAMDAA